MNGETDKEEGGTKRKETDNGKHKKKGDGKKDEN